MGEHVCGTRGRTVKIGEIVERFVERCEDPSGAGFERYVGVDHIDSDDLVLRNMGTLADGTLPPTFRFVFRRGMVLFPTRRPALRKCAVAPCDGVTGEKVLVLRTKDKEHVAPEFLPFILSSERVRRWVIERAIGSVTPHFRWADLAECEVVLPPLDQQARIAQVLLSSADVRSAYVKAKAAAAAMLSATVDHLAERALKQGGMVPLASLAAEGRLITYGIVKPGLDVPGGVPVIKVKDIRDGYIDDRELLLADPAIEAQYRRSRLNAGDLLISIRGTVGRLAFVPPHLEGANITQDTARLSVAEHVNREFVRTMMLSSFVQRQIRSKTTGLAVQGINLAELRLLMIPLPSRLQQDEAVVVVAAARRAAEAVHTRAAEAAQMNLEVIARMLEGNE